MKAWLLFFLGNIAYFLQRYNNRRDKKAQVTLGRYWKENWSRIMWAFVFDLIPMIILMDKNTQIDMSPLLAKLPFGVVLSGKLALSAIIGYGIAFAAYHTRKKKVQPVND